jgi:Uma2 family endonuclease
MNDLTPARRAVEYPARFSVAEFQQMVDAHVFEGHKVELVEGNIVRMSPASPYHIRLQRELTFDLHDIFRDGIDGYIAAFEMTIQFSGRTLRDIDVAIVKRFDDATTYPGPDIVLLAAEISVTTQDYDLNDKRIEYARAGIPHYWVVDVGARATHVMTNPVDGDYTERTLIPFGEEIPVPGSDGSITIGTAA